MAMFGICRRGSSDFEKSRLIRNFMYCANGKDVPSTGTTSIQLRLNWNDTAGEAKL
jgi:hypothetical protein